MSENNKKNRKICVFTGTRAEYGLLRPLMEQIDKASGLKLQLMVSGMHLSPEFGLTYKEIEADGFQIDEKIEILLSSDTSVGIGKSVGLAVMGYSEALERLKPDIVLILGDRFELFAAAASAMILQIPIAHIHGGEITQGAIDDQIRHAITKMSHLHFASTKEYKKRIVQMGENPKSVFHVGALGVENIKKIDLLNRDELCNQTGIGFFNDFFLITFHPATFESENVLNQLEQLLQALDTFKAYLMVFTKANADEKGRQINEMIDQYCKNYKNAVAVTSLGQLRYLSALKLTQVVVGNSSSGIIEAPGFNTPSVNIGSRQDGRIRPDSVIDCSPVCNEIISAIKKALAQEFIQKVKSQKNPYEKAGTSKKIKQILQSVRLDKIRAKEFHDLNI